MTIIANIRYADEKEELLPLTFEGIDYVMRHGDNSVTLHRLDYSTFESLGYASLGEEISLNTLTGKITFINSDHYNEYQKKRYKIT